MILSAIFLVILRSQGRRSQKMSASWQKSLSYYLKRYDIYFAIILHLLIAGINLNWKLKILTAKIFISFQIDFYGKSKAKVSLSILDRLKEKQNGKYVVVAGYQSFFNIISQCSVLRNNIQKAWLNDIG